MTAEIVMERQIEAAKQFIDLEYLDRIAEYDICPLPENERNNRYIRLYRISKIVYDKDEDICDKLTGVFNSVMSFCNSLVLIIKGEQDSTSIYLGVRSRRDIKIADDILRDSFFGYFPGSQMERLSSTEAEEIFNFEENTDVFDESEHIACMNVLPSRRGDKTQEYIQGLEKFIDTMRGSSYICEIIAAPMGQKEINIKMKGYEELYTALSPFEKRTISKGSNESSSTSESITKSISRSISNGITRASGVSSGHSYGKSSGYSMGMNFLLNFGMNESITNTDTTGYSSTTGTQSTESEQDGQALQQAETKTTGTTESQSLEYRNKSIENLLKRIDVQIDRLKNGMTYGMWETAVYLLAPQRKTVAVATSCYRSLVTGDNTGNENAHVSMVSEDLRQRRLIKESLKILKHPLFEVPQWNGIEVEHRKIPPVNYINGKELPLIMSFPRKSVGGVSVTSIADFGRNILYKKENASLFRLGKVFHKGIAERGTVVLDREMLTSHCFIAGSTGSGKSNTVYTLIEKLSEGEEGIPFLVIEPAKGEYRDQFRRFPGISLFTTNPLHDELLKLNPFSFNEGIHILEHLDRLVEIFNTCWEMYAAMPAILKESIEQAYIKKGWDLINSVYTGKGCTEFPTFYDVLQQLPRIINSSSYSSDTKGDYIGSLVTRVSSMTNGIYGRIFCNEYEIDEKTLFDSPAVIDLSRVGSSETKSLIMGLLVLKLSEYRMAEAQSGNNALRHVTILEEAHNILKNTAGRDGTAGNSIIKKSVEMIVNSIAEMRTYGESFIIVDQSPTSVDIAAVKNTNTKIIMRLPEKDDCMIAGHSIALNTQQEEELAKLGTGIAAVMQNGWEEPVLTKIDHAEGKYAESGKPNSFEEVKRFRSHMVTEILDQYVLGDTRNTEHLIKHIDSYPICASKKNEMERFIRYLDERIGPGRKFDSVLFGRTLLRLIGCGDSFKRAETLLKFSKEGELPEDTFVKWKRQIASYIDQYVILDDQHWKALFQYILYSKRFENDELYGKYAWLYQQIFHVQ